MSLKFLIVLTLLAALLGGLALTVGRTPQTTESTELGLLFPDLADRLNDAAAVEVRTAEGGYTLKIEGGRWVLVDKGGYPIKVEDIRRTLWALSSLQKLQPMTDEPARYDMIDVQDVTASGAPGKQLVLRNAAGAELAALIVGRSRGTGNGVASFFARVPSERRSWMVEGDLPLPTDADAWLDRQPVKLERKVVRAVRTQHPGGEVVNVSRPSAEQETFDLQDIPEGRELRFPTAASGMATALEYLSFQDVASAADFEAGEVEPVQTSLWTFDGVRVDVRVWSKGEDEHWAAFDAAYDPAAPADGAPAEEAAADAVRERAQEMSERLTGWVYRIAPYNKGNLAKRMEDLTQPIAPPDAIAAPEWDVDMGTPDPAAPPTPPTPPSPLPVRGDHDHEHGQDEEQAQDEPELEASGLERADDGEPPPEDGRR